MPTCKNCGAELEGKFCSSCGTPNPEASTEQTAPVQPAPAAVPTPPPVTQPVQQPQPQRFNPPPAPVYNNVSVIQQTKVTSTVGWVGWFLLLSILPLIGHIIMLCCTTDQSAKNFVKAQFLIVLIVLVIAIAIAVFAGILGSSM